MGLLDYFSTKPTLESLNAKIEEIQSNCDLKKAEIEKQKAELNKTPPPISGGKRRNRKFSKKRRGGTKKKRR